MHEARDQSKMESLEFEINKAFADLVKIPRNYKLGNVSLPYGMCTNRPETQTKGVPIIHIKINTYRRSRDARTWLL